MKNKTIATLLAFFLGGLGMHRFYLGQVKLGLLYLCFFWTFIPAIVALIDSIILFSQSEEKFNFKYNNKNIQQKENTRMDEDFEPIRFTHFYPTLAGFQYHNAEKMIDKLIPGVHLELKRDPENSVDPNAIEVLFQGQKLGFLPKDYAKSFAKQVDKGDPFSLTVYGYDPSQTDFYKLTMELIDLNYYNQVKKVITGQPEQEFKNKIF